MTQDEIIEMARQAGFTPYGQRRLMAELEAFAKLVAMRTLEGTYDEMIDIVRKEEREACAKICDEFCYGNTKILVEKAIRARGEA